MKIIIINRKRMVGYVMLLTGMLMLFLGVNNVYKETMKTTKPMSNMVIVIDPGHGGWDPGSSGRSGTIESDLNLGIAIKLRKLIELSGGTTIMIREDGGGLYTDSKNRTETKKSEDLKKRHEIINNSNADLFISIHLNHFPQSQYYGAQTFYKRGDESSKKLAEIIQSELITIIDRGNRREIKSRDDVYILNNNTIPGALVECGFLSNAEEERLLKDAKYQQKLAWSIYCGIMKYYGNR